MTKEVLKLALEALEPLVRRAAPWGELDWLNGCKAITAIKEALAQPEHDYKDLYEKEKRKSAMWLAKYEEVAGPAPKAIPMAQPDQYAKGYADAMNWKVQNHLEHLPAAQKLSEWKLVPKKPTDEMLKAMDECSTEGYDERLYAGYAASVYMAAVDVAPSPPHQPVSNTDELAQPEQEPVCDKEPQGCWNVRCQLGKKCKNASPAAQPAETSAERTLKSLGYTDNGGEYWKPPLGAIPPKSKEQEPVAHRIYNSGQFTNKKPAPQRTWVELTDNERNKLWRDVVKWGDPSHDDVDLMKAIEAKLKEKNT